MPCALDLARVKAGKSRAARIAMIAITTSNSIKVKPRRWTGVFDDLAWYMNVQLGLELEQGGLLLADWLCAASADPVNRGSAAIDTANGNGTVSRVRAVPI